MGVKQQKNSSRGLMAVRNFFVKNIGTGAKFLLLVREDTNQGKKYWNGGASL